MPRAGDSCAGPARGGHSGGAGETATLHSLHLGRPLVHGEQAT